MDYEKGVKASEEQVEAPTAQCNQELRKLLSTLDSSLVVLLVALPKLELSTN